jgi:hypothetical protein
MSGSCCGGTTKSEHAKGIVAPAKRTTKVATEQQPAKSECCNDKSSAKSEKHSCGC